MSLISDLLRGMVALSILAMVQHGCTIKDMAREAASGHQKGLSSYGGYSRMLTGHQGSWLNDKDK